MSYKYDAINYEDIKLDTFNPRLPTSLHNKSEETILEYMLLQADVLSLIEAIGENGFFPGEPIIIFKDKDGEKKYKVLEGNRRLSAVKLINNPNLAPVLIDRVKEAVENIDKEIIKTLTKIDCLIATDDEINKVSKFLGYRHITGTKNWKSLERARYLDGLYSVFKKEKTKLSDTEIYKELAKAIGSKTIYIKRVLTGFKIYKEIENKKFFHINSGELNDKNFHFVNLADSLNRKNIMEYLGVDLRLDEPLEKLNYENVELWARWLFENESGKQTRITGTSTQVGLLDKVLGCDESKIEFVIKGKSLIEANEFTENRETLFNTLISKAMKNLEDSEKPLYSVKEYDYTLETKLTTILNICKNLNQINNSKKKDEKNEFKLD
jgi:hypothetical protein